MAGERLEIRIPAWKLLVALLVIIIPISIAALASLGGSRGSLERSVGNHFKTIAEMTAGEVANYIHNRVTDVGVMAMEPTIIEAAAAANRSYAGRSESAISAEIAKIDKEWNTAASDPLVQKMLASPASKLLRRHRDFDPRFLRITVTDARGAAIAATHKTLDYYQADEEFWQNIYANGRGAVSITDILYDDVTKAYYVGLGMPILEEGTNHFIGTIDALVDVTAIFPAIQKAQLGPNARTMLVKDDGTVISAPGVTLATKLKSEEYAAIRDALQTVSGRQTGYLVASLPSGNNVIGFADTGLKEDYPNLGWLVVTAQDTADAFAPIRGAERLLALMSVLGFAGVTLFGVYIYMHRQPVYTHIGAISPAQATTSGRAASA